jgi:hypothetical protein
MRNIKFLLVCLLQVALIQLVVAQNGGTDKNGRPEGSAPNIVEPINNSFSGITTPEVGNDDRDIPIGGIAKSEAHVYYPQDLEVLQDELLNSAHVTEMVAQIEAMKRLIRDMNQRYDELQQENALIRRSLNACCSANELGLSASDAYLLQNAPNPFNESSRIAFFVPRGLNNAQIELRDVKGVLLETFDVDATGMSNIDVDGTRYQSGTYLYYLSIDGEVVDSKVMILNK